jgi:hypothetical protein
MLDEVFINERSKSIIKSATLPACTRIIGKIAFCANQLDEDEHLKKGGKRSTFYICVLRNQCQFYHQTNGNTYPAQH